MKAMLGDLNKDGKMSSYETARQNAIEKSMAESPAKKKGPKPGEQKKTAKSKVRMKTLTLDEIAEKQAELNQPKSPAKKYKK